MERYTGSLYWPGTSQQYYMYPKLGRSIRTEAAVVGSGVAGMLCGYLLAKSGISTTVVDSGEIGGGATLADMGIVQFANDIMLSELIDRIGERNAVRLYAACRHALEHLSMIADGLSRDIGFKRRSSLIYASGTEDLNKLEREFRSLRTYGFDVEFWSAGDIRAHFPFHRPGAIVTHGDAEINPYLLVHETASAGIMAGMQVYEYADVVSYERRDDVHRLVTADGFVIEADCVIYATGRAPLDVEPRRMNTRMSRSYAIVTNPQPSLADWHQRFILRETSAPYLYLRTTQDGRIIAGGLRELSDQELPACRDDRKQQIAALEEAIGGLFPDSDPAAAHEWCASSGESLDRLPYIGEDPDRPGVYYSLGCGGNRIVYSMLAAQIIRDLLQGERHSVADLLRLGRPLLVNAL